MTRRAAITVTAPAQVLDEVLVELDPQTWTTTDVVPSATSRTPVREDQDHGQQGTAGVSGVGNGTRQVRTSSPRWARRLPQARWARRLPRVQRARLAQRLRPAQPLRWARWARWVLRALVLGLASAAAAWAVAVLDRFSGVFQVCAVVTFLYTAGALWYVAVGQYVGGSTAPTRRSRPRATPPAPEGSGLRAIEGPRALALPAPPVTVTVTAVQDLGGGPR